MFELLHPLAAMSQTQGPGHMVIDRIADRLPQTAVHLKPVALHVHHRPRVREVRTVARRMPSGACGEFILFQQDAIGPARAGKVV